MSEWIPEELTPEQEAEYQKTIAEASEDDPPEFLNRNTEPEPEESAPPPKGDDPEPDAGKEATKTDDAPSKEAQAESEAEKTPEKPDKPAGERGQPWYKELPDDAKVHFDGLKAEMARLREKRRNEAEQSDARYREMLESIPSMISDALEKERAKAQAPDPDLDLEGYAKFKDQEAQSYRDELDKLKQTTKEQKAQQELSQKTQDWVLDTEAEFRLEHPDYDAAAKYLLARAKQSVLARGATDADAVAEVNKAIGDTVQQYYQRGWNVARYVYNEAVKAGWRSGGADPGNGADPKKAPSRGEEDAASIQAGAKASKNLGGGGAGGSAGELTLEDILKIDDPDEHKAAYDRWVAQQLNQPDSWMPA